ncbi:unnamed protein product [Euphydryas editha]|uniref:Uncharacterized protein n=1 Tax=Euphydryas editha TaxID=104508 RepID=A0AAU9V9P2_EUPED|nr:unnamed protein product [Euphydryas editha]
MWNYMLEISSFKIYVAKTEYIDCESPNSDTTEIGLNASSSYVVEQEVKSNVMQASTVSQCVVGADALVSLITSCALTVAIRDDAGAAPIARISVGSISRINIDHILIQALIKTRAAIDPRRRNVLAATSKLDCTARADVTTRLNGVHVELLY